MTQPTSICPPPEGHLLTIDPPDFAREIRLTIAHDQGQELTYLAKDHAHQLIRTLQNPAMTEPIHMETAYTGDLLTIDPPDHDNEICLTITNDLGRKTTIYLAPAHAHILISTLQSFLPPRNETHLHCHPDRRHIDLRHELRSEPSDRPGDLGQQNPDD